MLTARSEKVLILQMRFSKTRPFSLRRRQRRLLCRLALIGQGVTRKWLCAGVL